MVDVLDGEDHSQNQSNQRTVEDKNERSIELRKPVDQFLEHEKKTAKIFLPKTTGLRLEHVA